MLSPKDILDVLDRWKDWKRMREAPDKIEALEARIAALEAKPRGELCPHCDKPTLRPRGHPDIKGNVVAQSHICSECGKASTVVKRV